MAAGICATWVLAPSFVADHLVCVTKLGGDVGDDPDIAVEREMFDFVEVVARFLLASGEKGLAFLLEVPVSLVSLVVVWLILGTCGSREVQRSHCIRFFGHHVSAHIEPSPIPPLTTGYFMGSQTGYSQ